jgi:hypothetical protein
MTAERWYKIQFVYTSRRTMLRLYAFKVQTVGSQLGFGTNTRGRSDKTWCNNSAAVSERATRLALTATSAFCCRWVKYPKGASCDTI